MSAVPLRAWSAAALVAVVASVAWAHTIVRGDRWAYEWVWALFQYQLVVVLVAPVVAGAAAWEAIALWRASEVVRSAGRSTAFAVWVALRVVACTVCGLALGVVPVVWASWRAQGVTLPPVEALSTIAPAAAQIVAVAVSSFVVASRWPRPIVVPIIAVGWFGGLIAANVVLPEQVARVGGASASLLGLHVPIATQLVQVVVALLVAGGAIGLAWATSTVGTPVPARLAAVGVPFVVLAVLVGAQPTGRDLFERRPVATVCVGHHPAWCVAPAYVRAIGRLRARTEPLVGEMDLVGVAPPARIVQGEVGRSPVEEVLFGDPGLVPIAMVYAWLPERCVVGPTSPLLDDLSGWVAYVEDRLAGRRPAATGAEATALASAAGRIATCEGS